MVSLKTHNILDYVIGAVLIVSPYLFGMVDIVDARNVFQVLGVLLIAYSLVTKYKYSVAKLIPLGVHMSLDVLLGVALIAAPYLFDYREQITGAQYALHVILGIGAWGLVSVTSPKTEAERKISRTADFSDHIVQH